MTIKIYKGYPIKFTVGVANDGVPVAVNAGNWIINIKLSYQIKDGPEPFPIVGVANGDFVNVSLTSTQTSQLDHKGIGYVLCINATDAANDIYLSSYLQVRVLNDL